MGFHSPGVDCLEARFLRKAAKERPCCGGATCGASGIGGAADGTTGGALTDDGCDDLLFEPPEKRRKGTVN